MSDLMRHVMSITEASFAVFVGFETESQSRLSLKADEIVSLYDDMLSVQRHITVEIPHVNVYLSRGIIVQSRACFRAYGSFQLSDFFSFLYLYSGVQKLKNVKGKGWQECTRITGTKKSRSR
jgi:hypothetical protein